MAIPLKTARNPFRGKRFFAIFSGKPAAIGFVFLSAPRDSARARKPSPFDCDGARCVHSAFCILHFSEFRGSILFGCGWPHWAFPQQNQGLKKPPKRRLTKIRNYG
jgi:hypothetical protein